MLVHSKSGAFRPSRSLGPLRQLSALSPWWYIFHTRSHQQRQFCFTNLFYNRETDPSDFVTADILFPSHKHLWPNIICASQGIETTPKLYHWRIHNTDFQCYIFTHLQLHQSHFATHQISQLPDSTFNTVNKHIRSKLACLKWAPL